MLLRRKTETSKASVGWLVDSSYGRGEMGPEPAHCAGELEKMYRRWLEESRNTLSTLEGWEYPANFL
jgi:hypothetical protein